MISSQLLKVDGRPIAEGRGNQVGSKRKASENIAAEPAPSSWESFAIR
jgi:hypothetical protein